MPEKPLRDADLAAAAQIVRQTLLCEAMLPWGCTDRSHGILGRYRAIGFDFVSITVAGDGAAGDPTGEAVRSIAHIAALVAERPEDYAFVTTAAGIAAARASGRMAVGFNFQGAAPFGRSAELVPVFAALGVRQVLLAYNEQNFASSGCADRHDAGLTKAGIRLVRAMQRSGIVVDGTHCGERASMEAIEIATAPFIFSHSNAFAVYPHYRNVTDAQIKAAAATGGYVGVNGLNLFLGDETGSSEAMFRHIDHIATLVGPNHAAIGFDYVQFEAPIDSYYAANEDTWPPNPYNGRPMRSLRSAQPEQITELVALMLSHGYGQDDINAILGGNYLRVAAAVWRPLAGL